jgi:hypothetical protein
MVVPLKGKATVALDVHPGPRSDLWLSSRAAQRLMTHLVTPCRPVDAPALTRRGSWSTICKFVWSVASAGLCEQGLDLRFAEIMHLA